MKARSLVGGLGYIGIDATDPDAWRAIAEDTLGAETRRSLRNASAPENPSLLVRLDDHVSRLVVHHADRDGLRCIGWYVHDEPALEEVHRRLDLAGVQIKRGSDAQARARGVVGLLYCVDPSGFDVEFAYGPSVSTTVPFRSTKDSAFVTGRLGLGHVALFVRNFADFVAFYRGALGFETREVNHTGSSIFLACNPRHHSVSALDCGDRPARLHHLMLEVQGLDMLGRAYDAAQQAGTVTTTLGRHWNDRMVSFYFRTPAGFDIELGWDGVTYEVSPPVVVGAGPKSFWGHQHLTDDFSTRSSSDSQSEPSAHRRPPTSKDEDA